MPSILMQQAQDKRKRAEDLMTKVDALESVGDLTAEQIAKVDEQRTEALDLFEQAEADEKKAAQDERLTALRDKAKQPRGRKVPEGAAEKAEQAAKVTDPREKDPKRGFRDDRDYMMAVIRAGQGFRVDERLEPLRAAVGSDEHSTLDDTRGGFLVPKGFMPDVKTLAAEVDPLAGLVTSVPMSQVRVGIPARVDKNHNTSVSGGLTVTRRMETDQGASSRMEFEEVELKAAMLWGIAHCTEELLSDSPISFAAIIARGFDDEFGSRILDERLNGLGAGEFLGVNNAPCMISQPKEGSQAADTIVANNVLKMRQRCWRYGRAVWLANHDTYLQLAQLRIVGDNGDVWLFRPGNGVDTPDTLLGRPIFFTEYAETLGDAGDLVLGVWSEFLEGEYEAPDRAESMHVRFENHERTFKFWLRNAGAPWWRDVLTPKRGANTLAPFVRIAARA